MGRYEEILEVLENMDNDDLVTAHNAYCEATNCMDDYIYDMDELDEIMAGYTPTEIASCVCNGDFSPSDDYFKFDGYGDLESFGYWEVKDRAVDTEAIAKYILDYKDNLNIEEIADILEEDNEYDPEEEDNEYDLEEEDKEYGLQEPDGKEKNMINHIDSESRILSTFGEREIINGKLYATETATRLAVYDEGYYAGHLLSFSMALFRKSDGEYFLYTDVGNDYEFRPITEEQAKAWVEEYANENYEDIFDKTNMPDSHADPELAARERNIELNLILYNKMKAELNEYKERLLSHNRDGTLVRAFEYMIRAQILDSFEFYDLPDEQAKALCKLDYPLEALYRDWKEKTNLNSLHRQEEEVWATVSKCANREINKQKLEKASDSNKEPKKKRDDKKKPSGPRL